MKSIIVLSFLACMTFSGFGVDKKVSLPKPFIEITVDAKEIYAGHPFKLKIDLMGPAGSGFRSPQPSLRMERVRFSKRRRFQIVHSRTSVKGVMRDVLSFHTELIALSKGERDLEFRLDFETRDYSADIFGKKINHSLTKKATIEVLPATARNKDKLGEKGGNLNIDGALEILSLNREDEVPFDVLRIQSGTNSADLGNSQDVVIALDISDSMLAEDMKPNRIGVAKTEIVNFIQKNKDLRIGLVAFSGVASCVALPGINSKELEKRLELVSTDSFTRDKEGTSIGSAILCSINNLLSNESKVRPIIILITDGESNSGRIPAPMAAAIAKEMKIKVYAIGIGKDETMLYLPDQFGLKRPTQLVGIDEDSLREIATKTGGEIKMAKTAKELGGVFDYILRKVRKTK